MLSTHQLTFIKNKKTLLEEISLSFQPGMLHTILGPNGSGKSTLLKNLACIWRPAQGAILWQQDSLVKKTRREISKIITLVPQNPQISFDFTVEEFVKMGRYAPGLGNTCHSIVENALKMTDAWQFKDRLITHLSQGERQRIYIARSLATEAPVMLLDEPTANLDLRHQIDIWQLLKTLTKEGKTIIVSNHDLQSTKHYGDRVYVLHLGRCVAVGSYAEVITPSLLQDIFNITLHNEKMVGTIGT